MSVRGRLAETAQPLTVRLKFDLIHTNLRISRLQQFLPDGVTTHNL